MKNSFINKATQVVSKVYSNDGIAKRAEKGTHKGESMAQVFNNITHDPNVTFGEKESSGNQNIYYKGKNIGWINFNRGMGWINDKAYQQLAKYVAPEPEFDLEEEDSIESEDDIDIDY